MSKCYLVILISLLVFVPFPTKNLFSSQLMVIKDRFHVVTKHVSNQLAIKTSKTHWLMSVTGYLDIV